MNSNAFISSVHRSLANALRDALIDKPPTHMRPIGTVADGDIRECAYCMCGRYRLRIPC